MSADNSQHQLPQHLHCRDHSHHLTLWINKTIIEKFDGKFSQGFIICVRDLQWVERKDACKCWNLWKCFSLEVKCLHGQEQRAINVNESFNKLSWTLTTPLQPLLWPFYNWTRPSEGWDLLGCIHSGFLCPHIVVEQWRWAQPQYSQAHRNHSHRSQEVPKLN